MDKIECRRCRLDFASSATSYAIIRTTATSFYYASSSAAWCWPPKIRSLLTSRETRQVLLLRCFAVWRGLLLVVREQWRKSGWNSGGRMVYPGGLVGWGVGGGTPSHRGRCLTPEIKFHLKWRVLVHSERYFFVRVLARKMLNFPPGGDFVDTKDVRFGNSEYSVRIMGLISFVLHYCIVMKAIWCLKFWNVTKSGGQFALASLSKFWRDSSPCAPWFTPMNQECSELASLTSRGSEDQVTPSFTCEILRRRWLEQNCTPMEIGRIKEVTSGKT